MVLTDNWAITPDWFAGTPIIHFLGDRISANAAQVTLYDMVTVNNTDEASIITAIEADSSLRSAIGVDGTLVLWGAIEDLYKITAYTAGLAAGTQKRYVSLAGGDVSEVGVSEHAQIGTADLGSLVSHCY